MNVETNAPKALSTLADSETPSQQETNLRYASDSYQKILDYHVGEILLTTIIFAVIILFRLHH